jgi:hypothetical protein
VTGSRYRKHNLRTVHCDPSKNKEGRPRIISIEPVERRIDTGREPARTRYPLRARDGGLERSDLEVFLDIDGEEVRSRI